MREFTKQIFQLDTCFFFLSNAGRQELPRKYYLLVQLPLFLLEGNGLENEAA